MLYIEDYGIPIPQFLKDITYIIPKIALYKDDHMEMAYEKNKYTMNCSLFIHNDRNRDIN
jgi:hypothetical protein